MALPLGHTIVHYVEGITTKLDPTTIKTEHAERVARDVAAYFGRLEYYEVLYADHLAKPYFDVDASTADTTADDLLARARDGLAAFFDGTLPAHTVIQAHGGPKLSFHFTVPGFRMRISDIKERARARGLLSRDGGPFDGAVYSARQKYRMIGSRKKRGDDRVLRPLDDSVPGYCMTLDCLVQVIDDAWPLLSADGTQAQASVALGGTHAAIQAAHAGKRDRTVDTTPVEAALTEAAPAPKKRGRARKEDTLPPAYRQVLDDMGFKDIASKSAFADPRGQGFSFSSSSRRACPCCAREHTSNNWFIVQPEPEVYLVKSHSEHCTYRRTPPHSATVEPITASLDDAVTALQLAAPPSLDFDNTHLHYHDVRVACTRPECLACDRTHPTPDYIIREKIKRGCWTIQNVDPACYPRIFFHGQRLDAILHPVLTAASHDTLSDLFLHGHANILWCCPEGKTIKRWDADRWTTFASKHWAAYLGWWLGTLLRATKQLDAYTRQLKALDRALGFVNSSSQVAGVRAAVEGKLIALSAGIVFDANPLLLGGEACVVELTTGVVRPPRLDDYVSKSTGFTMTQQVPPEDLAAVEAVVARIYPVEEERALVQQFAGYALRGDHPAKHFLCLTDRRAGNNGKSTICSLLRGVLGPQYSRSAKKELLYEQRYGGSVNDHDSGLAAFEGLRLITMEEPAQSMTLNTALLKELNGGGATLTIREAHSAITREMAWTAKMVVCFNQNGLPKLRVDDEAFLNRVLYVQHRARFCKTDEDWAKEDGQPHTFAADSDALEALTKPAALAWMLQGAALYQQERFSRIPPVCGAWLSEAVDEQDEVAAWRLEHVRENAEAWLSLKAAFIHYQQQGGKLGKRHSPPLQASAR